MADPAINVAEQINQLNAARNLVLGDAAFYPQIVQGIVPIIGPHSELEVRRWGADFLAETFASPTLSVSQKEDMSLGVLDVLRNLLEVPNEDTAVTKSVIQAVASLYPVVFRHVINTPSDTKAWEQIVAIKQNILRRWDSAPYTIRMCCVKFVQKVVEVQTPGLIADPRRPEKNETSLSLVPRNHPLLSLPNLEAEASGLLDRLLDVFTENSSDAILVNATLNCLPILVRTRQSIGNKIINAILSFNPLKNASSPVTPTMRVNVKSMERTARALFINVLKRNPNHPLAGRMQQYIERLSQSRLEIFDDASRKRGLPTEDVVDSAKRARVAIETPPQIRIPPLPPGHISFAQLFTLTEDAGLASFDVKQLPLDLIVKIVTPVLAHVDQDALTQAVAAVRDRYEHLKKTQPAISHPPAAEDDDDYEPEYQPMDVSQEAAAQADAVSAEIADIQPDIPTLGPFVLPQPAPLTEKQKAELGKVTVSEIFNLAFSLETPSSKAAQGTTQNRGFGRLAASSFDRDSWLTLLTRLATRPTAGLVVDDGDIKTEDESFAQQKSPVADHIRDILYRYILEDFRSRMNTAISWLNEEWYNERIQLRHAAMLGEEARNKISIPKNYDRWVLKLLDGFMPYLDARDKILIRFLSEIPEITSEVIERVKSLARDPERVNLCVQAFHYLILVRPPVRDPSLDALEDLYRIYEESRPLTTKVFAKWRPLAIQPDQNSTPAATAGTNGATNGIKTEMVSHPGPNQANNVAAV